MKRAESDLERKNRYLGALVARLSHYKEDLGKRLEETRRIFGKGPLAVDIHTHSVYSDGWGTIEENRDAARNVQLDFVFASDHNSLRQKRSVAKWPDMSWGQEPGSPCGHHIGLLEGRRLFKPAKDTLAVTVRKAQGIAPFVWIPHPTGWYWCAVYPEHWVDMLWTVEGPFAMEVLNGAAKCVHAYDNFDARAVATWDRLLCDGRQVTPVGGSDAHCPLDIGTCWTGAYAARRSGSSIIAALNRGHCFASESSFLDFGCGERPMGSVVASGKGKTLEFRFRAADSAGLAWVRLVSRGRVVKEIAAQGKVLVEGTWGCRFSGKREYFRLESAAVDNRRAFSAPIYVEPA